MEGKKRSARMIEMKSVKCVFSIFPYTPDQNDDGSLLRMYLDLNLIAQHQINCTFSTIIFFRILGLSSKKNFFSLVKTNFSWAFVFSTFQMQKNFSDKKKSNGKNKKSKPFFIYSFVFDIPRLLATFILYTIISIFFLLSSGFNFVSFS